VKPGLIAAGIVSAWTWAATLVSPFISRGIALIYRCVTATKQRGSLQVWCDSHARIPVIHSHIDAGISGPWWYGGVSLCPNLCRLN
jgi:hypothetical protein